MLAGMCLNKRLLFAHIFGMYIVKRHVLQLHRGHCITAANVETVCPVKTIRWL